MCRVLKNRLGHEEGKTFTPSILFFQGLVLMATETEGIVAPGGSCHSPQDQAQRQEDRKTPPEGSPGLASIFSPFHAGTLPGMRKGKNPSFKLSLSIFSKAHSTADLISSKSTGFMA